MNENQNNVLQHVDDEIDLRELIMVFWRQRKLIITITLIAAILTGLFSMFVLSPVYDTKLNIVINMPEKYNTRYGEYTLPITTNEQYIELIKSNDVLANTIRDMEYMDGEVTIEDFKESISIGKVETKTGVTQNSFDITVSADDAQESLKLAKTLYNNYIEFMDVMTKERAISFYYNDFSVQLKSLNNTLDKTKRILEKNEELLAQTPQTINQKEAMQAIQGNTSEYVVLENIINPNYTKIESDVIANKQSIINIESSINLFNDYLEEITSEKVTMAKYYDTGSATKLESSIIGVVETSVYLPSPPVAPTKKTSPSNTRNVALGTVLGAMIAIMVVFIKDYWLKKS